MLPKRARSIFRSFQEGPEGPRKDLRRTSEGPSKVLLVLPRWGGADGLVGDFERFSRNPPERLAPGGTLISMQEAKTAEMSFSDHLEINFKIL